MGEGKGGPYVKKILIYMATSTRRLTDPARAALVELRGALENALRNDKGTDDFFKKDQRRIEAYVLVHGYQVDTGLDLGATEFTYVLKTDKPGKEDAGVTWSWPVASGLAYLPGDTSVLQPWITQRLRPTGGITDSTALIIWGHGQGIGTDLRPPLPAGLPSKGVTRPSFLNIGGFGDRALAQAIEQGVTWDGERWPLDLLVFDSCLMAGVELAYEFRRVARYLVASQSFVNTEPGGPPGLNLGAAVSAFVQRDAWVKACARVGADPAKQQRESNGNLLEAGTDIVNLIGDTRSGAQQLTLFRLQGLDSERIEAQDASEDAPTDVWLREVEAEPMKVEEHGKSLAWRLRSSTPDEDRIRIAGLVKLFAYFLRRASTDSGERERILHAVRSASFARARQFLDLQNLARQAHEFSRHRFLQLVALAIINELEPHPDGFVVFHRAALPFRDRPRFGGVAVYCPWFAAQATAGGEPLWDVLVDHDEYHRLALNRVSDWSRFALGSLYDATAPEREPRGPRRFCCGCRRGHGWYQPCHVGCYFCCACGGHWPAGPYGPYPPYPYPPYAYGPFGSLGPGDKPSGGSLGPGDKQSGGSLGPGDKQSNPALGPHDDDDYA